jgi:hypothetical protein
VNCLRVNQFLYLVTAVNSTEPDWSRKGNLVDDIRMEIQTFTCWTVVYIRWEANHACIAYVGTDGHDKLR